MQYLWQLQIFSDISVQQTDLDQHKIALKFSVKELPILDKVIFAGNKNFDNDELRRKTGLGEKVHGKLKKWPKMFMLVERKFTE